MKTLVIILRKNPRFLFFYIFFLSLSSFMLFFASFASIKYLDKKFQISEKIIEKRKPSSIESRLSQTIVQIKCQKKVCSGNIIGKNKILTSKNCIKKIDQKNCKVSYRSNQYPIDSYYALNKKDLLVIKTKKQFSVKALKLIQDLPKDFNEFKKKLECQKVHPVKTVYYDHQKKSFIYNQKCFLIKKGSSSNGLFSHNCTQKKEALGASLLVEYKNDFYALAVIKQKGQARLTFK